VSESTITGTSRFTGGGPSRGLAMTLFEHYSGFYGCSPAEVLPDGHTVVGWKTDGDHPSGGFYAEPASGPVELIGYLDPPSACAYRGIRVTAAAIVAIDLVGRFGGISPGAARITVSVRRNGVIIASELKQDSYGGVHAWGGAFTFSLTDVAAVAGDEFEVSVKFELWLDFAYFATIPGNANADTHFRVIGDTIGGGGEFLRGHATFAASL